MCENHPFPTALRPLAMIEMACKRSLKVASSHHATTYYPYQMCTLPEWTITPGQPASHSLDVEKQSRPTLNHEAGVKRARRVHVLYTKSPHSDEE